MPILARAGLVALLVLLSPSSARAEGGLGQGLVLRHGSLELAPDFKLYLDYQHDLSGGGNAFHVSRAYLGLKVRLLSWLGGRVTYDVSQAGDLGRSGSISSAGGEVDVPSSKLSGSLVARLKYAYLELRVPLFSCAVTFGVVHTPWIPWMEHIEGTRFLRTIMFETEYRYPSADFGAAAEGHVGQHLSWALGLYSGEGYHGVDDTGFKDLAGRISLRPAPGVRLLTALQLSGTFQAQLSPGDDEQTHQRFGGALSYRLVGACVTPDCLKVRDELLSAWVQVFFGRQGRANALADNLGLSVGGRLELPWRLFVLGRLDRFDPDLERDRDAVWRVLAAAGIHVYAGVNVALDMQTSILDKGLRENLLGLHAELTL